MNINELYNSMPTEINMPTYFTHVFWSRWCPFSVCKPRLHPIFKLAQAHQLPDHRNSNVQLLIFYTSELIHDDIQNSPPPATLRLSQLVSHVLLVSHACCCSLMILVFRNILYFVISAWHKQN